MRRQKASKRWNEVNVAAVFNRKSLFFNFAFILDHSNGLCPFDSSSSCLNRPFKRILSLTIKPVAYCSQKTILRKHWLVSYVSQDKASCSISSLDFSWLKQMTKTSRLLVPKHSCNGYVGQIGTLRPCHAAKVIWGVLYNSGQPFFSHSEHGQVFIVPLKWVDVHEHSATCIGWVSHYWLQARKFLQITKDIRY